MVSDVIRLRFGQQDRPVGIYRPGALIRTIRKRANGVPRKIAYLISNYIQYHIYFCEVRSTRHGHWFVYLETDESSSWQIIFFKVTEDLILKLHQRMGGKVTDYAEWLLDTASENPYFGNGVLERKKNFKNRMHLATETADRAIGPAKPSYENQAKSDKRVLEARETREALIREIFDDDELGFLESTFNTFELEGRVGDNIQFHTDQEYQAATDKFRLLTGMYGQRVNPIPDFLFLLIWARNVLQFAEFDADLYATYVPIAFTLEGLLSHASKNSAHGAMPKGITHIAGGCRSTFTAINTGLAAHRYAHAHKGQKLSSFTLQPKDERVKDGKKVKQFNPFDAAASKLHGIIFGPIISQQHENFTSGALEGMSMAGGNFDEVLRLQVGLWNSTGRATDEQLAEEMVIQEDYVGFEYNHHPIIAAALILGEVSRYCNKCRDSMGNDQLNAKMVVAAAVEELLLPDLRPTGQNVILECPIGFFPSGHDVTLNNNGKQNKNYTDTAALALQHNLLDDMCYAAEKNPRDFRIRTIAPNQVAQVTCGTRTGDDGMCKDTPLVRSVKRFMKETFSPVKWEGEKEGHLVTTFNEQGEATNDGVAFCKQNICLHDTGSGEKCALPRRTFKYLYKVVKGNTSNGSPEVLLSSTYNHATNAVLHPKVRLFLDKWHDYLAGITMTDDSESATLFEDDPFSLGLNEYKSEEEIIHLLTDKNVVQQQKLYNSLERRLLYNVPLDVQAHFQ